MKIVNVSDTYRIFPDDLRTFDKLPNNTFKVEFSPQSGFSLEKQDDLKPSEGKIYGNSGQKVDKIMRGFKHSNRSFGAIFSGDKGMGKSLAVQQIAEKAHESNMPVILVKDAFIGVSEFIDSIEQEALIVFDEFEKVFNEKGESYDEDTNTGIEPQSKMLSLLDGLSRRKKLYIVTVNDMWGVSQYMVNRPGRFHYHIKFGYPTQDEISEYMKDKIPDIDKDTLKKISYLSQLVNINYDSLRAISFELLEGYTLSESLEDLNIDSVADKKYVVTINLKGDEVLTSEFIASGSSRTISGYAKSNKHTVYISLPLSLGDFDKESEKIVFDGKLLKSLSKEGSATLKHVNINDDGYEQGRYKDSNIILSIVAKPKADELTKFLV